MKCLRSGSVCILLAALVGCASLRTEAHYDTAVDFSKLATFRFADDVAPPAVAAGASGDYAPKANEQIRDQIQQTLTARSMTSTDAAYADVVISHKVGTWAKNAQTAMDGGINGKLWIHFLEPNTQQVIFQGSAQVTWYSSMDPALEIEKAVSAILAELPAN